MNDINFARAGQAPAGTMDASTDAGLRSFMLGVYNKMGLGLALTAILAAVVASNDTLLALIFGTPLRYVVMFGPLAILFGSSFVMKNPSPAGANIVYWSVATLIGLSMGGLMYTYANFIPDGMMLVAKAFLTTSIAFGGLSYWGYTTKKDISGWGTFLIMALIGLVVASLVNFGLNAFFPQFGNPMFGLIISMVGVLIFAGLTAWETQQLKFQYYQLGGDTRAMSVATTYGALGLYLSFINMFQMILHIMTALSGDD